MITVRVLLKFPDNGTWHTWAELCTRIIMAYGGEGIRVRVLPVPDLRGPQWSVLGGSQFLVILINLVCTILSNFHRYHEQHPVEQPKA